MSKSSDKAQAKQEKAEAKQQAADERSEDAADLKRERAEEDKAQAGKDAAAAAEAARDHAVSKVLSFDGKEKERRDFLGRPVQAGNIFGRKP